MLTRAGSGQMYRVGRDGATITWRDGSVTVCFGGQRVLMDRVPLKIEGRLYRVGRRTSELSYEAPALEPAENKELADAFERNRERAEEIRRSAAERSERLRNAIGGPK